MRSDLQGGEGPEIRCECIVNGKQRPPILVGRLALDVREQLKIESRDPIFDHPLRTLPLG